MGFHYKHILFKNIRPSRLIIVFHINLYLLKQFRNSLIEHIREIENYDKF